MTLIIDLMAKNINQVDSLGYIYSLCVCVCVYAQVNSPSHVWHPMGPQRQH